MIYFCIPAHNEESTAGVILWKIRQVMADFPRDFQLLVLDDASTDATAEVLEPYMRVLPLTVLRNDERQGYAAALERLLREAVRRSPYPRRDVIVTVQADFTEELSEIPTLLKRIESGADVVTSAATLPEERTPRLRRWARKVYDYLLHRLHWPEPVTDPLSGFRAYRLVTIKKAMAACGGGPLLEWDGWAANAELLRAVLPHARRVEEVPVRIRLDRRRRRSRLQPLDTAMRIFRYTRARGGDGVRIASKVRERHNGARRRKTGTGGR